MTGGAADGVPGHQQKRVSVINIMKVKKAGAGAEEGAKKIVKQPEEKVNKMN